SGEQSTPIVFQEEEPGRGDGRWRAFCGRSGSARDRDPGGVDGPANRRTAWIQADSSDCRRRCGRLLRRRAPEPRVDALAVDGGAGYGVRGNRVGLAVRAAVVEGWA